MATVFVAGERLFVKDGENMSREQREKLKLAAWSILVNRRQPDDLESVGEEPESNRPVRFEPLPRHGCSDREEDERAANSDPTAALGERALQPVLSGCPVNSEILDFDSLSRYMDCPPETEEVKLTDWGLSVTRYTDGRAAAPISRPKWKKRVRYESPKLSSNVFLLMPELMQENSGPMLIEDLCQAFTERFVDASNEEKERLQGTIEVVVRDAITNLRAKLIEAGLLKNLETTFVYDLETGKRHKAYRLLGVLSSDNRDSANNQDNLLVN